MDPSPPLEAATFFSGGNEQEFLYSQTYFCYETILKSVLETQKPKQFSLSHRSDRFLK